MDVLRLIIMPSASAEIGQTLREKIRQRAAARSVSQRACVETVREREPDGPADLAEAPAITRKPKQLGYIDAALDI